MKDLPKQLVYDPAEAFYNYGGKCFAVDEECQEVFTVTDKRLAQRIVLAYNLHNELLAACKELLRGCEANGFFGTNLPGREYPLIATARSAIMKAEGRA